MMQRLFTLIALVCLASSSSLLVSAHEYSSNSTACTRNYIVQAGDTCDKIGQRHLVSTYQVLAFNLPEAGPTCETLEIGHELCLGRYGNDCQVVHRCTPADTCSSIAAQYKIPLSLLQDNNPSMNCGQIYDGLVLCVAPGVMRPPPVAALDSAIQAQQNNNGGGGNAKRSEDGRLVETVMERDGEAGSGVQLDEEAINNLRLRVGHAAGASRHARGIHAPVVRHHA